MIKLVYSLLLVGTSGGVGLAAVVGWLNYKLYKRDEQPMRKSQGLLYLSIMIQNGILVTRLVQLGTAEVNPVTLLYVSGLVVSTIALAWRASQMTGELALLEAVHNGHDGPKLWLENVERRLVAEEARNAEIEKRADASEKRADEAEEREHER